MHASFPLVVDCLLASDVFDEHMWVLVTTSLVVSTLILPTLGLRTNSDPSAILLVLRYRSVGMHRQHRVFIHRPVRYLAPCIIRKLAPSVRLRLRARESCPPWVVSRPRP